MKQLLSDALLSYNVLRNERRRFVICFEIRDPLPLFYFAFLSQAAEEAQLKEDKKQQRRERRKASKQSDVGGAKQSRNQSANQPGNQPSKRKRPQTSHVFFEDSDGDENSETKTAPKRRKGDHFTADADVCLRLLILRLVAPATSLLASYACVCSMQMSLQ